MEFRLEKAERGQYAEVAELIQAVWDLIEEKSWFSMDDPQGIYDELVEERGIAYVAVEAESGALAGVFITAFPEDDHNLGRDIGMAEEELPRVAHMDYAAVLPEYRGNGLQYRLMQMGEEDLRSLGYRHLMCTVHPENQYSMGNVERQGYRVMKTKEKYGGLIRNILLKEI